MTTSVGRLAPGESADVKLAVSIADGWHINSNQPGQEFLIPTTVEFEVPAGVRVGDVIYPPAVSRQLRFGGDKVLRLFEGDIVFRAPLTYERLATTPIEGVVLFRFQACNDTLCLPPETVRIPLPVKFSMVNGVSYAGFNEESADAIARMVGGGWWVIVPSMLLLGLALNLTPCVYPLISVTIAYFGRQAGERRTRTLWLSLAYAAGIALTFSVLGVSAALSGSFFGSALGNPWVLMAVSGVMVALALSSFGFYQIQLPASLGAWLGRSAGGILGALLMGLTMGVVAAPCVGPVVVGLLVFVGSRGDVGLGLSLFLLMSVGLGLPYVVLGMAAGSIASLPRSGDWLQWTEHLFGCVLLAMAIYFVEPILPSPLQRALMPSFVVLAAIYLAFADRAGRGYRAFLAGRWAVGAAVIAVVVVRAAAGLGPTHRLEWTPFSAKAYSQAMRSGAPFVIEFSAQWCLPCREMEERTFTDPKVIAAADGIGLLTVDMTTSTQEVKRILRSFDVVGAPTILVFGRDGEEHERRIGFVGPRDFAELLRSSRQMPVRSDIGGGA